MGGWALNPHDLRLKARIERKMQLQRAYGAVMSPEPVMPPDGINPLRWKVMVQSLKNAIEDGDEGQVGI
jgi:hypothetical protein